MSSRITIADWLEQCADDWEQGKPFELNAEAVSMHRSVQGVFEQGYDLPEVTRLVVEIGTALSVWQKGGGSKRHADRLREVAAYLRRQDSIAHGEAVVDEPEEFIF